jgi:hypothetical protein
MLTLNIFSFVYSKLLIHCIQNIGFSQLLFLAHDINWFELFENSKLEFKS